MLLLIALCSLYMNVSSHNQTLSFRRAQSVADYLVSQRINSQRLIVLGYGESRPIASNSNPSGRAQNRRVELLIEPHSV